MENSDPKIEILRGSLVGTLNELAVVFGLNRAILLEKIEEVIVSVAPEQGEEVWKGVNQKLKEAASLQTDKLAKLKEFLIEKGYTTIKPYGQQDEADAILAKLHTYLWDKGSVALPHNGGQAELFYFVANKIFNVE
jgi:hypothetical protein